MAELYDPNTGRGAWTVRGKDNGSVYYIRKWHRRRDGSRPDQDWWHQCVHQGVLGIQQLLFRRGYATPLNGVYGIKTKRAVKKFQRDAGLLARGAVGSATMTALMVPIIDAAAFTNHVDPSILYGIARQESGFDPGAQGFTHPPDMGLWQDNTDFIPWMMAFDPEGSAYRQAERLRHAMNTYIGKGVELRTDCAIAQHNSPLWADQWFANGVPPNEIIENYVASVIAFAAGYGQVG